MLNVSNDAKSILTISLNDGLYGSNTNADTDVMTLRGDGNVGIGTTSPIDKLNVNGGTGDATTQQPKISLTRTSSTGNVLVGKMIVTTKPSDPTNHGNLVFQVKTTASAGESSAYYTNAITIDGKNANVGIGTDSPYAFDTTATKLHVKNAGSSGSPSEVARFEGSSDANGSGGTIRLGTSNDRGIYFEGGRTGSVPYGEIGTTEYDGTKTLAITLDNTGNVGIGDTPSFKLDVNVTSSRARFKATTGNADIELSSIAGHDWLIRSLSDDSFAI